MSKTKYDIERLYYHDVINFLKNLILVIAILKIINIR